MAERGPETLRHGPMKPVGLTNPHDPQVKACRPWAVVQLRQDNALGTLYNMVGFQTKLNLFRAGPRASARSPAWRTRSSPASAGSTATPTSTARACSIATAAPEGAARRLRFAGQITGC